MYSVARWLPDGVLVFVELFSWSLSGIQALQQWWHGWISFKCEDILSLHCHIHFYSNVHAQVLTENCFLLPGVIHRSQASQSWEVPQLHVYYGSGFNHYGDHH
jgi:hypothetical protein